MRKLLSKIYGYIRLPLAAKAEHFRDLWGPCTIDPGAEQAVHLGISWLGVAQDCSASRDGGVARDFSLISGWNVSYPETTGYIVPTLLDYARTYGDNTARQRAIRMLDWLASIQLPDGSFQAGLIDSEEIIPTTFNTGQILLGFAAGVREIGRIYYEPMRRAADWLVRTQDPDGCWRQHGTPYASLGEKAYETHVAWGLFESARVETSRGYAEAAIANLRWALSLQLDNGWFHKCCLNNSNRPLAHTIGYVLRGVLEGYLFTRDADLLKSTLRTADGLMTALRSDGFLPGRLLSDWSGAVEWACLTGISQISICWLKLYQVTGDHRYLEAALVANCYVRKTVRVDGPSETKGAVKGSFPVSGDYGKFQYPNWACKFHVDTNMLELDVRTSRGKTNEPQMA